MAHTIFFVLFELARAEVMCNGNCELTCIRGEKGAKHVRSTHTISHLHLNGRMVLALAAAREALATEEVLNTSECSVKDARPTSLGRRPFAERRAP